MLQDETDECLWSKNQNRKNQVKLKAIPLVPGHASRFPGVWSFKISRQSAHEGGKVVSPTHRPPLHPGNNTGTYFCQMLSRFESLSATARIMKMKNSNYAIANRTRGLSACGAIGFFCGTQGRRKNQVELTYTEGWMDNIERVGSRNFCDIWVYIYLA